ncbi:MAG: hypothetical protein CVU74_01265 [Deltaproteobacteria bacterium HGW-Deltaproteobacteria-9]|jgi:hypothetical protein|nr:MAG: hypothetical protein CVU74_01265 [Deltaproteobacteria bacterium HGW-Deltaproteobacteria-9]
MLHLIGLIIAAIFILLLTFLTDPNRRGTFGRTLLSQRGALTADKKTEYKEGVEVPVPVAAATKIFAGAWACVNAAGFLVPGADTAALIFQGISRAYVDNSLGSNGDLTGLVLRRGLVKATLGHAITQANVGDNVFLVDDETVDLTANTTNDIFCGVIAEYIDSTHAFIDIEPAIRQADVATHIADTSAAHAASAISITDAGNHTAQTDVEGALQEIYPKIPVAITDPGASGAIPVTKSGTVAITTTGAETRTIAIPGLAGIEIGISMDVDGGDCVITAASAINQTGNNTITLNDAGDTIVLKAVKKAGALVWRVVVNDGATLSTV